MKILDVPLILQKTNMDCGNASLRMAFSFFGKDISWEEINELSMPDRSGAIWTQGLLRASAKLGFDTEFYSLSSGQVDSSLYEVEFVKENSDSIEEVNKKLSFFYDDARNKGALIFQKSINLDFILSKYDNGYIPIVLLAWKLVKGKTDSNHFVTMVGYDDDFIYVNDPYKEGQKNMKISKDIFDKARKIKDTEEDILFIKKKE